MMVEVRVVGSSMYKIDRHYNLGLRDLAMAVVQELKSKLKEFVKPDVVLVANAYGEAVNHQLVLAGKLTTYLGLTSAALRVEAGDGSGGSAIFTAYSLLKSGIAKTALILGVEKLSDYPSKYLNEALSYNLDEEYSYQSGLVPHVYAALLMKAYMKRYNVDYSYFANWSIAMHSNAVENPYAYLRFPANMNAIISSQVIAEPLRLFDIGARGDGAAAVYLATDEVSSKISDEYSKIEYVTGSSSDIDFVPGLPAVRSIGLEAKDLLKQAELAEIHDSYSVMAALQLEELGLAEYGKSLKTLDSLIPINYSGGLKARGYPGGATGVYQLAEVHQQLVGEFKGKRVSGAERGFVLSTDDLSRSAYLVYVRR